LADFPENGPGLLGAKDPIDGQLKVVVPSEVHPMTKYVSGLVADKLPDEILGGLNNPECGEASPAKDGPRMPVAVAHDLLQAGRDAERNHLVSPIW
jgi:hypothetical protein